MFKLILYQYYLFHLNINQVIKLENIQIKQRNTSIHYIYFFLFLSDNSFYLIDTGQTQSVTFCYKAYFTSV